SADRFEFIAGFGVGDRVIQVQGRTSIPAGVSPRFYHVVTPDYFSTVRLPLVAGRLLTADDRAGAPNVVVINEGLARQLWPDESPLGHAIKLGSGDSLPWVTIVGVVGDVTERGRRRNYAYVSASQNPGRAVTLLLRGESN